MKKHIKPCICETCERSKWIHPCSDGGHLSFWNTVVSSPQWKIWEKEVSRRTSMHNKKKSKVYSGVWDTDECRDLGYISPEHFQDFIKFITKLA